MIHLLDIGMSIAGVLTYLVVAIGMGLYVLVAIATIVTHIVGVIVDKLQR